MRITKENIVTYWDVFTHADRKGAILKYIIQRCVGLRKQTNKDIILDYGNVKFNCGKIMGNCWVASKHFEPELEQYYQTEGVVIDVGANIGKHSILMAQKLGHKGRVIAIEPSPDNYFLLVNNRDTNGLWNIETINVACSSRYLIDVPFYCDPNHPATNTMEIPERGKPILIDCVLLDSIVSFRELKNITLIKIDVEGHELEVLKGATTTILTNKPLIIFEAWTEKAFLDITAYLIPFGYSIKQITKDNYLATPL